MSSQQYKQVPNKSVNISHDDNEGFVVGQPVQNQEVANPGAVILPQNLPSREAQQAMSHAKVVRWAAVIDCFFCLAFILIGAFYMLAIIILPLLGYFGAKSYSRNLVLMYLVYLVAIIAVRIALIAVNQDDTYTAIQSVIIILEILVIVYIIRLYRVLGKMSDEDKFYLIGPRIMDDPDAEDSSSVNPDDENNQQAPYS